MLMTHTSNVGTNTDQAVTAFLPMKKLNKSSVPTSARYSNENNDVAAPSLMTCISKVVSVPVGLFFASVQELNKVTLTTNWMKCHLHFANADEDASGASDPISHWNIKKPWPPPKPWEIMGAGAELWPIPWPSFWCVTVCHWLSNPKTLTFARCATCHVRYGNLL